METTIGETYCAPLSYISNRFKKMFDSNPQVRLLTKAAAGRANLYDITDAMLPIKSLCDKINAPGFKDQLLRNFIYTGVKWTTQRPTLISIFVEIIQVLDNIFGLINLEITTLITWITEFITTAGQFLIRPKKVSTSDEDVAPATAQVKDDMVEPEHLSAICAAVGTVLSGTVVGLGASCFQDGWKTLKKFADNGRTLSNFERGAVSAWHIVEYIFGTIQKLFDKILHTRALRKAEIDFKQHGINIIDFINHVDSYIDPLLSFEDMKKIRTMEQAKHLKNICNKIEGLMTLGDITTTPVAKQIVLKKISDYRTYLAGNNFAAEDLNRAIPYGVMIVGGPGCGKSLFGNLLAAKITQPGVIEGHPYKVDDIYWWNPAKKFMDNYVQQAVVVIDDDGALKDVAGCESGDHKKLLMFSNGAYYPEFARLEDKGRAFTSEVIISSANIAYPEFKSLRDSSAMWRRRNLLYWQTSDGPSHTAENWRFRRMRPVPTGPADHGFMDNDILSYQQVLAEVVFGLEAWRASKSTPIDDIEVDKVLLAKLRAGQKKLAQIDDVLVVAPESYDFDYQRPTDKAKAQAYDSDDEYYIPYEELSPWDRMASIYNKFMEVLETPFVVNYEVPVISVQFTTRAMGGLWIDEYHTYKGRYSFEQALHWSLGIGTSDEERSITEFMNHVGASRFATVEHRAYYRAVLLFMGVWQQYDEVDSATAQAFGGRGRQLLLEHDTIFDEDRANVAKMEEDSPADKHREWCIGYSAKMQTLLHKAEDGWYLEDRQWSQRLYEWVDLCLRGVVIIVAAIGLYKLLKWSFGSKPEQVQAEVLNYDNRTVMNGAQIYYPEGMQYDAKTGMAKPLVTLAEGCANKNTCGMLYGTIKTNTYWMTLKAEGRTFQANAVVLKGTDVIFAKHSLAWWEGQDPNMEIEFTLTKDTISYRESIKLSSFRYHPTKDFAWVRMTLGKIHSHKSLVAWMAPQEDLAQKINGFDCATVSIALWDTSRTVSFHYGSAFMKRVEVNHKDKCYQVRGYATSMIGGEGLCGRLLVDTTAGIDKPIVGLHVAGLNDANNSVFYPICQKDVELMEDPVSTGVIQAHGFDDIAQKHKDLFLETDLTEVKMQARIPCPNYKNYAIVSSRLEVVPRDNTSFEKTILHNKVMENVHAPSPLSLRNPNIDPEVRARGISPQELAEGKYTKETNPFPKRLLEFAKEGLTLALMPIEYPDWSVMNLDQALNGDGGHLQTMNMHSSPGTEFQKLSDDHKGKHAFVRRTTFKNKQGEELPEAEQRWEVRDEEHKPTGVGGVTNRGRYLLDDLERIEQDLKEGREVFSPASSSMKDETLPKAKVWVAKVRLFMTLAMSVTILTRRYFGAFLAASVAYCTHIPLAIGVDAYGPQWTMLYDRMNRWGGKCIAADFKSFDSQADGECMLNAADAISDLYDIKSGRPDPLGRRVRMGLVYLFIHTYVVCRNLLYRKAQGIPSGVPVTAPLNSCVNIQYLIMCVKDLTDKAGFNYSVNQIMNMLEILVYGDDFVLSIHPELEEIITFRTMRDWFAQYLIVITPESKNGEDYDYRTMKDEVTFLKRKWSPEPGDSTKIRAPIEMETIAGIINWQRKKNPRVEMMKSLIEENYLQELFHHGRSTYDKGLKALNDALQSARATGWLHPEMTPYYANDYNERHVRWLQKFN